MRTGRENPGIRRPDDHDLYDIAAPGDVRQQRLEAGDERRTVDRDALVRIRGACGYESEVIALASITKPGSELGNAGRLPYEVLAASCGIEQRRSVLQLGWISHERCRKAFRALIMNAGDGEINDRMA
jgi:hypothetical protein